jgi:hypothetical protein
MSAPYAELVDASNFSFLRGAALPQHMVLAALLLGQTGLGIADRKTVAGVVRAYSALRELREEGVPPPEGAQRVRTWRAYLCRASRHRHDADTAPGIRQHLPPRPGSGAALRQRLRARCRRSHPRKPKIQPSERTQNWITFGGNVTRHLLAPQQAVCREEAYRCSPPSRHLKPPLQNQTEPARASYVARRHELT